MRTLNWPWPKRKKVVIGMVHLLPLAGAPQFSGSFQAVLDAAARDAQRLAEGGVEGIMIENFGDVPFFPGRVPAAVIAQMTVAAAKVKETIGEIPLGINVLRNDGESAMAIASAVGAAFVRINVLCGARVTDQGVIQGIAHDVLRLKKTLAADSIGIWADVDVKHSAALAPRPIEDEVDDTLERGLADAVIVSGAGTGKKTDPAKVRAVAAAVKGRAAVVIGSGVTAETAAQYLEHADAVIVGTAMKKGGVATNPVEVRRVRAVVG